jgi:hypothetical protein
MDAAGMKDYNPPPPGSLVRLDPEKWDPGTTAVALHPQGYTHADFMGRSYTWLLVEGRIVQVPPSHIVDVHHAAT